MSFNQKKSTIEMNVSSASSVNSFYPGNIIDLDFDDDAYNQTYEKSQKSHASLHDTRRQVASPKKENDEMKIIHSLIDDSIEEEDFQEAFTLFLRFSKNMDESKKKLLFNRYYEMLVEPTK